MDTCKYVHYEIDYRGTDLDPRTRPRHARRRADVSNESDVTAVAEKNPLKKFHSDKEYFSRKMLPPQASDVTSALRDDDVIGLFVVDKL